MDLNAENNSEHLAESENKTHIKGIDYFDWKKNIYAKNSSLGKSKVANADNKDVRGIQDCYIDDKGHLIIVFTDGTKKDVGKVVGEDGVSGVGIAGMQGRPGVGVHTVQINDEGHLIVRLTDGREIDAGYVGQGGGGGTGTGNVFSKTITTIWTGSLAEYNAIKTKGKNTLYFIEG